MKTAGEFSQYKLLCFVKGFHMKKVFRVVSVLCSLTILMTGGLTSARAADYPERLITAIVPFAPGGSTDIMARTIATLAEAHLKQSVVVKNVSGGNGSIGAKEALDKKADGYTILITAENLASYRVMGVSPLSFNDYDPIILLARGVPVIVTKPESQWKTANDLIKSTTQKPGEVKIATTGPTGVSGIVATILGAKFNMVPFKSEGEIITAVLGGHTDVATVGLLSVADYIKAGKLKVLAVVNDKKLPNHPDWAALGEAMPEYNKHLPWGPFYGVWVKKGMPADVVAKLKDSFSKAADDPKFKEFVVKNELLSMNVMGADALKFANDFTSRTTWLLFDGGAAQKSPAEFGIPRL